MPVLSNRLAPIALLLAGTAIGCGPGPFARAATTYAAANTESATALGAAPKTAFSICRQKAHVAYLQVRLGIAMTPEPIPWNAWYATAKATEKQSWEQYCKQVEVTGEIFSTAVSVLREYGTALSALASGGVYDGSDIERAATNAGIIAQTLEATGPAAAAKPVGFLLSRFATFLFADVTDDNLEDYVRRADPIVQPLVAALEKYVEAIDDELKVTENAERQTLKALEIRGNLIEPPVDPDKLILFYRFALATEDDIANTREVLDGYRAVASKLRAAHGAMLRAALAGDELDIKKALGSVFELLTQLQILNAALAKE